MILQEIKVRNNIGELEGHDFNINIDEGNVAMIMNLLSKGFYSNVHESIVREYLSNCWDSHVEAKCEDKPIQVKIYEDNGNYKISFNDFGIGLSPNRIKEIFTSYFSSTKRNSNSEIGGFGLGSKSGFAYTDNFFVYTWYEGIKYSYLMTKNELGVSRLEKLGEENSTRTSGTSVVIQFIKNSYYDKNNWVSAIKKQTPYFNNLYYDVQGINNDFNIYRGKYFTYSELNNRIHLHILLGQVPYIIDHSALGINLINLPIALNFKIGELMPTPNRESIIFTEEAKELILQRIKLAANEIVKLANKQRTNCTSLDEFLLIQNKQALKLGNATL